MNGLVRDPTRCLTGPMPGLTRDSVSVRLQHDGRSWHTPQWPSPQNLQPNPNLNVTGRRFELVDTAGLTRVHPARTGQHDSMDVLGMDQSLRSMRFANVVGLVVDAAELARAPSPYLPRREAAIAKHVRTGSGAAGRNLG